MNYLQYLQEGNKVEESDLIRLDNDPKKGALIKGDFAILLDKIKNFIIDKKNMYDRIEEISPKTNQNNSSNSNNQTDISTIIASSGYVYNPFKTR